MIDGIAGLSLKELEASRGRLILIITNMYRSSEGH